jgi:hypothetical protein
LSSCGSRDLLLSARHNTRCLQGSSVRSGLHRRCIPMLIHSDPRMVKTWQQLHAVEASPGQGLHAVRQRSGRRCAGFLHRASMTPHVDQARSQASLSRLGAALRPRRGTQQGTRRCRRPHRRPHRPALCSCAQVAELMQRMEQLEHLLLSLPFYFSAAEREEAAGGERSDMSPLGAIERKKEARGSANSSSQSSVCRSASLIFVSVHIRSYDHLPHQPEPLHRNGSGGAGML